VKSRDFAPYGPGVPEPSQIPLWAAIAIGAGGGAIGGLGSLITGVLAYRATKATREAVQGSAAEANATAQAANELTASKLNRDMITVGGKMIESSDETIKESGYELLETVALLSTVSEDDAKLARALLRRKTEPGVEVGRALSVTVNDFVFVVDEAKGEDDDGREGGQQ
jgi:hypothetical protein